MRGLAGAVQAAMAKNEVGVNMPAFVAPTVDSVLGRLGYSQSWLVEGGMSIADLFPVNRRCGVYALARFGTLQVMDHTYTPGGPDQVNLVIAAEEVGVLLQA